MDREIGMYNTTNFGNDCSETAYDPFFVDSDNLLPAFGKLEKHENDKRDVNRAWLERRVKHNFSQFFE